MYFWVNTQGHIEKFCLGVGEGKEWRDRTETALPRHCCFSPHEASAGVAGRWADGAHNHLQNLLKDACQVTSHWKWRGVSGLETLVKQAAVPCSDTQGQEMHWENATLSSVHELGQTPPDGEGKGSLTCCSPWGREELDTTWWQNSNICIQWNVIQS